MANALIGPYNEAVGVMVESKKSAEQQVQIVDMKTALASDQYNDTLHPNNSSYATMAKLWIQGNGMGWVGLLVNLSNQTSSPVIVRNMTNAAVLMRSSRVMSTWILLFWILGPDIGLSRK